MLNGIDGSPCSLSLRNRNMFNYEMHQNKSDLKMFLYKNLFFFNIFYSFNPNHAYWNQRLLFSGNLLGMLSNCSRNESLIFLEIVFDQILNFDWFVPCFVPFFPRQGFKHLVLSFLNLYVS